jgi:hypothetical protein
MIKILSFEPSLDSVRLFPPFRYDDLYARFSCKFLFQFLTRSPNWEDFLLG